MWCLSLEQDSRAVEGDHDSSSGTGGPRKNEAERCSWVVSKEAEAGETGDGASHGEKCLGEKIFPGSWIFVGDSM